LKHSIEEICLGLLEEAVNMYERDGALMTTSFAVGHARSAFTQPMTEHGCEIDDETRIRLQAMLASSVGAVYIGRIDESFIGIFPAESAPLSKGQLEQLAKTDASIRTAIVVQAVDTRNQDSLVYIATLGVDDNGEAEWEQGQFQDIGGPLVDDARKAIEIASHFIIPLTDIQLREELFALGWQMVDSDDIGNEYGDEL
jgi:hypothetical protein